MKPHFILALLLLTAPLAVRAEEPIDFNRQIRPILSDKCYFCHGPDKKHREADLRFDEEEAAKADLGGYAAIVPGKPEESALIERIHAKDEGERMPPPESGKVLTAAEKELLERWIAAGAPWAKAWNYEPPRRHAVPEIAGDDWSLNEIDRFILARLQREKLEPSPEADRATLLRRLSFDLLGLPPTPAEVAAFTADDSPEAYERAVDRLLASEHFGERMAILWLDLVRYADTVGYHGDQDQNISPYRDWVIDAFNRNLPFDQFTREQLAGDLLPEADIDQRIATGYNRLLQTTHEGGLQPKEYLAIYSADRVRNVSAVWMGATLGCAQCHDHKYDPLTARDFYSMAAFFADVDEAQHFKAGTNSLPTKRPPEIAVHSRREREHLTELKGRIEALEGRLAAGEEEAKQKELETELAQLRAEHAAREKARRVTMVNQAIEPRPIRVVPRGNWLDESGPLVEPAVPTYLGKLETGERRATRLDLAEWLTSGEAGAGGLTARVMVNRFWAMLFGVGLAKNLEDFGGQGEAPLHPELLDHLALEFLEGGWDVKRFIKLLVMSRTYRQSSDLTAAALARDPENRLLARQSRYRLPAEMIRDNALAVSGLLVTEVGGGSVRPYQPEGYYRHLNFPKRTYNSDENSGQWRRGVYVHWQRQFLHPMLKAFDAPSREECTAERPRSNTPLAALVLLNDPTFVEAARVFAAELLHREKTPNARLELAMLRAVSRPPDEEERTVLLGLLAANQERFSADGPAAAKLLAVGRSPLPEKYDPAELAAYTMLCRAVLNLNETYSRK